MPPEIRASLLLWLTALLAIEAGLGLLVGRTALRLVIFLAALYLVAQMALGRRWARAALVLAALVSTPGLAAASAWWLSGDRVTGPTAGGLVAVLFAASVIAHTAAVGAATVYMFRPAANRYFRDARRPTRAGRCGAAPAGRRQPVAELR